LAAEIKINLLDEISHIDKAIHGNIRWQSFVKTFKENIENKNVYSFLNWKIIRDTMFCYPHIDELSYLKRHDWKKWGPLAREDAFGKPPPFPTLFRSSGNRIHHLYHIARFEEMSNQNINDYDIILEFGGGYGSMCRLIYNAGFKGTYIIYDFPEFNALQRTYLNETKRSTSVKRIFFSDNINDTLKQLKNGSKVLFVGMWSISETDINFRNKFLSQIQTYVDTYFIAYQTNFSNINNEEFFSKLKLTNTDFSWKTLPMLDKIITKNYYLIGKRNEKK